MSVLALPSVYKWAWL